MNQIYQIHLHLSKLDVGISHCFAQNRPPDFTWVYFSGPPDFTQNRPPFPNLQQPAVVGVSDMMASSSSSSNNNNNNTNDNNHNHNHNHNHNWTTKNNCSWQSVNWLLYPFVTSCSMHRSSGPMAACRKKAKEPSELLSSLKATMTDDDGESTCLSILSNEAVFGIINCQSCL